MKQKFDQPPYNFSIELYTYWKAKKHGFVIKRAPLRFENRKHGTSSWNKGLRSKMKLSIQMICDSVKIRIGSFKEK